MEAKTFREHYLSVWKQHDDYAGPVKVAEKPLRSYETTCWALLATAICHAWFFHGAYHVTCSWVYQAFAKPWKYHES